MFDQFLDLYEVAMTPPGVFVTIGVQLAVLGLCLGTVALVRRTRRGSAVTQGGDA